ncbi:XRE family transcriptional regulator [Mycolicibacterium sp. 050232]|uniref:XRE family transcriptional regulator n=1 Tax=Mycolicibacterium sp. 050232 TaxID=3113982 RepID=UPI002E283206|nr:XRE family transcriptional regulator [Mycolicibacterium sp. 050232]MED5813858.1 XRE family transcriptional regulator [Mycolicibacterium sp. 050232]
MTVGTIVSIVYSGLVADEETKKKNPLGATGETVAENVRRLRGDMQYTKLAARLIEIGRPIPTLGLRKIESNERRVDTDDLLALAAALEVSPIALLMPYPSADRAAHVDVTGAPSNATAEDLWAWLIADRPLPGMSVGLGTFRDNSWPEWHRRALEELDAELRQRGVRGYGDDK